MMIRCRILLCLFIILTSCVKEEVEQTNSPVSKENQSKFINFNVYHNDLITRSSSQESVDYFRKDTLESSDTLDEKLYLYETQRAFKDAIPNKDIKTRATSTSNSISSIKICGYRYSTDKSFPLFEEKVLDNYIITPTINETYMTDVPWPMNNSRLKFFATEQELNQDVNNNGMIGPFTIDSNPNGNQKDIKLAVSHDIVVNSNFLKKKACVDLKFRHVLSGIRFKLTTDPVKRKKLYNGEIRKIIIKNVRNQGIYNLINQRWEYLGQKTKIELSNTQIAVTDGNIKKDASNNDISNNIVYPVQESGQENIIYVLPQALRGAEIEIHYFIHSHTFILRKTFTNQEWVPGEITTYTISNKSIKETNNFDVKIKGNSAAPNKATFLANIPHNGTYGRSIDISMQIISNQTISKDGFSLTRPLTWKVEFSETGKDNTWTEKEPDWLSGLPAGYNHTDETSPKIRSITAYASNKHGTITDYMRSLDARGTEQKPIDLSLEFNGNRNTANCYVINASGWYKIPLVYGNAIKDGGTNISSYSQTAPDIGTNDWKTKYWRPNFPRHDGQNINGPWITINNGIQIKDAEQLWYDSKQSIIDTKNLKVVGDYIVFKVDKNSLQQGNCVIAAKTNNNEVAWSWHIWFTPLRLYSDRAYLTDYGLLKFALGYNDDEAKYYYPRDLYMRITQLATGKSRTFFFRQNDLLETSDEGRATYYQGGRKDPFPPVRASRNGTKNISVEPSDGKIYAYTIKNPHKRLISNKGNHVFTSDYFYNVWNNNNNSVSIHHTAYWGSYYKYQVTNPIDKQNEVNMKDKKNQYIEGIYYNTVKTVYDPSPAGFVVPPAAYLYEHSADIGSNYNPGIGYMEQDRDAFNGYVKKGSTGEGTLWTSNVAAETGKSNWTWMKYSMYFNTNQGAVRAVRFKYPFWGFPVMVMEDKKVDELFY